MKYPIQNVYRAIATLGCVALSLQGCGIPTSTVALTPGPDPIEFTVTPNPIQSGGWADVQVVSASADSIAIESDNGLDRYWNTGPKLSARIDSDFGDSIPQVQYAVREHGRLLDVLKKPVKIVVCRQNSCREYDRELSVQLPERNERSVAITGGWSTAFTRRAVTSSSKAVLLREALNHTVWNVQAELAKGRLSARLGGFYGADERGGSLDLSREIKSIGGGFAYGLAMHVAATHAEWLPTNRSAVLTQGTAYRASIGPSIMVRGLTASSQIGIYTDGRSTLQEVSTFVSLNGGLTEVRNPITITLEKTFAFGGEPLIPRRSDQLERLTVGIDLVRNFALRLGMSTHRSAWPTDATSDLRASEIFYTLGGQYTLSW
ncbi:MAG TPA: hypothetical protein VGN76_06670 [Gemmatimonadales bacterium]|jgi:hypothetical protein|nr:hypothetical protein [Gemmatimonadales bacterium]